MNRCSIDDSCIGCNACICVSRETFAREGNRVVVRRQPDTTALLSDVREARAVCPVGAISLARRLEAARMLTG